MTSSLDSFKTAPLSVWSEIACTYGLISLAEARILRVCSLPYSLKILLENLMRLDDEGNSRQPVVPFETGIVHQVNIEYLAGAWTRNLAGKGNGKRGAGC